MDESGQAPSGFFASLRRLADTGLSAIQNRVELFALELQEERQWLISTLLWAAATVFLCMVAVTLVTLAFVLLFPAQARPAVLIGLCVLYVLLSIGAIARLRRKIKDKPPPLSDTISELKKDIAWLKSRD